MMTHRRSTHPPTSESSVVWYKVIAISFLILAVVLVGMILYMTTKRAMITILAKEDLVEVRTTVTVGSVSGPNTALGVVTSTSFYWSKNYFPGATESVEGTAKGTVTIYNKTDKPMALVKTTRLLSDKGVLFRLSNYIAVPPKGKVDAEVYADKSGKDGDVQPGRFTIPGLTADLQASIYGESSQAMSGGNTMIGVVTQTDLDAAQVDFKEKVKNAFLTTYASSSASADRQVLVTVLESTAQASQKPGDKIKMFTLSGTSTLAMVTYNASNVRDLVQKNIDQKIDTDLEKLLSADSAPVIMLNSINLASGTAELGANQTITVTLNEESSKVKDKTAYVDKTKDEILQYVKTLPHAISADITFSPSWLMRTSPSIPEKIILKGVKMVK